MLKPTSNTSNTNNSNTNNSNTNNTQSNNNKNNVNLSLPIISKAQAAQEFSLCLNDMRMALHSVKSLGHQWTSELRQAKHSQLDQLFKLAEFENVHKMKLSEFIISKKFGNWPSYHVDMKYWLHYDRNLDLINKNKNNNKNNNKHNDINEDININTHSRSNGRLQDRHYDGNHSNTDRSRSRENRIISKRRSVKEDNRNIDIERDNRRNKSDKTKETASMFKKKKLPANIAIDDDALSIASTSSEIREKKDNEHYYSDYDNLNNDSDDAHDNIYDSFDKNKKRLHENQNKSVFTDMVPFMLTEQLAVEGINGRTMKRYIQVINGASSYSNSLLKQVDKLSESNYCIFFLMSIYSYFGYWRRVCSSKRDIRILERIEAETYRLSVHAVLHVALPSAMCTELMAIFNNKSNKVWNILKIVEEHINKIEKCSSMCVGPDYIPESVMLCDNENLFKTCSRKNKSTDKCQTLHNVCFRCRKPDCSYWKCPKVDPWKKLKLQVANSLSTKQCEQIISGVISLTPYYNQRNNYNNSYQRGNTYTRGNSYRGRGTKRGGRGRGRFYY